MSYRNYVIAAYCVFAIVLAWDFVVPRIQRRALLRAVKLRAARNTSRAASAELNR
jgi:heme exporter protein D